MMTGELGFSELVEQIVNNATIPGTDIMFVPLPHLTIALFLAFVLMVAVVLVNLLVCIIRTPFRSKLNLM